MRRVSISCIVEGHGDVEAVPILVRRIVRALDASLLLHIPNPPVRVSRDKIVKPQELEKAVTLAALKNDSPGGILILVDAEAALKNDSPGGILILVDADQDCPAALAPELLKRAQDARSDMPVAVVLAKREYEAWFLAAAHSLRGRQGLSANLEPPPYPEEIQGAKEWLRQRMEGSRKYSETVDQAEFTRHFDLQAARHASSFDKLCRDVEHLLKVIEPLHSAE